MKKVQKTIFSEKYGQLVESIVKLRHERSLTQRQLADILNVQHSYVSRIEVKERRLDLLEFFTIMRALKVSEKEIMRLLKPLM